MPAGEAAPADAPAAAAPKKTTRGTKTGAKKSAAKKKSSSGAGKKVTSKSSAAAPREIKEPSDAEIQLRAYFLAERRAQLSLEGDAHQDWLDAKQQLMEEAREAHS